MKLTFALLAFALSMNVFAVDCKISNLKDAQKCMNKVAATYTEYENPNDGVATVNKDVLKKVLKALGQRDLVAQVNEADYVGFMLEHGDEHHLYYFVMQKGNSKAVELYEMNLVDLSSMLEARVTVKELFLGTNFDGGDVVEDIQESINDFVLHN